MSGASGLGPAGSGAEDRDTARLVARFQAGDREAFSALYTRYFDRVFAYLKVILKDHHEAEDAAQQVFVKLLEALPRYERRRQPFRAWLFTVVRNYALSQLEKLNRLEATDPAELHRRRQSLVGEGEPLEALGWITDEDLLTFAERLPLPQRQVLLLRYMLDLSDAQIAAVLGRSREDVRALQHRAILFLRERLTALGRAPKSTERTDQAPMTSCPNQAFVLRERRFALGR